MATKFFLKIFKNSFFLNGPAFTPLLLMAWPLVEKLFFCGFPKKKERNVGFPNIFKINKLISNKICETKVRRNFLFLVVGPLKEEGDMATQGAGGRGVRPPSH